MTASSFFHYNLKANIHLLFLTYPQDKNVSLCDVLMSNITRNNLMIKVLLLKVILENSDISLWQKHSAVHCFLSIIIDCAYVPYYKILRSFCVTSSSRSWMS